MGILSGLDQFGLGDLEGADLYADPTKGADAVEEEKAKEPEIGRASCRERV